MEEKIYDIEKLANNWNKYRDNVRTNLFYKDRIHFAPKAAA